MAGLIDLTIPEHSYLFGFIQGDGHLYRNPRLGRKGQLSIELGAEDRRLLEAFQQLVACYSSVNDRQRDTNFREGHVSSVWSVCNLRFREELVRLGLPSGRKSGTIAPPTVDHSDVDYVRGLIDADGSLGLEAHGLPFIALTTSSVTLATAYQDFLHLITGKRKLQGRNQRDSTYNIMVWKEDAQAVVSRLYYPACLPLHRKYRKALELLAWVRPAGMRRVENRRSWSPDQDAYVLSHAVEESMSFLKRNRNSVTLRRNRLRRAPES
jgi:hypothetical protein